MSFSKRVLIAKRIVIAAGSRPAIPTPWYALGDRLLINDDVFAWDTLPESIAVVGTGVIGLEISQALSRLGVRVHLFGVGNKFGPISDPFISAEAKKIFEAELNVSSDARVDSAERTEQGVRVTYSEKGEQKAADFACLLAATGRRSNLDELNLEAAGVILNERGMPAFNEATGQIEDKPLFIAGDVSNAHPLLHEAADDGRIAGDNAGSFL